MHILSPVFRGLVYSYRTLVTYIYKPCTTVAPSNSLLATAVLCAISVVKANHIQGGASTNRVRGDISISVVTNSLFW